MLNNQLYDTSSKYLYLGYYSHHKCINLLSKPLLNPHIYKLLYYNLREYKNPECCYLFKLHIYIYIYIYTMHALQGHESWIEDVCFGECNKWIVSCSKVFIIVIIINHV